MLLAAGAGCGHRRWLAAGRAGLAAAPSCTAGRTYSCAHSHVMISVSSMKQGETARAWAIGGEKGLLARGAGCLYRRPHLQCKKLPKRGELTLEERSLEEQLAPCG